jgi:Fur family transcriptional regulator, ferric uptake regulator
MAVDWSERLAQAGLRRTQLRITVLQALAAKSHALSHNDIVQAIDGPVDRVTLYRALDSFVEAGLVTRQIGADRISRFMLGALAEHDGHSHFTCERCGAVYCMPEVPPPPTHLPTGFELHGAQLHYSGDCASCTQPASRPRAGAR